MVEVPDAVVASVALVLVTASFPFYVYGAWYILDEDVVTWAVLVHHLKFVFAGLGLNTVPVLVWMVPRLPDQFGGTAVLHAFFGVQAYALLVFALTGIVRIFEVKRAHDLYADPGQNVPIDDLHPDMPHWRRRLRVGVAGYVVCWLVAWIIGLARFLALYVL